MLRTTIVVIAFLLQVTTTLATEFTYAEIAKRYAGTQLDQRSLRDAKMHGECLFGLKKLNFRKQDQFDPVAEWTNYRSLSLLEQFPPCEVLIMIEVARKWLIEEKAEQEQQSN